MPNTTAEFLSKLTGSKTQIVFVKLTNTKGSTVESPTVVETSIVLAVGNNQPSVPRLK
ncbi:hypothetical protein KSP40_PGU021962 [Platanthera guangdongensis]|uniref:Uncharacterized protein n=1 Tax=Platanthera guangdongensis TaxID=2320717 RepID=A0ABR2LHQ7_9ASPA